MQRLLHFLSIALASTVGFCLVVVQPFPVLHDFPEWIYQGWLAHHLLFDHDPSILNLFSLAQHPVPNSITQFAVAVLNLFASPILSGKIWLAVYLVFASMLWTMLSLQLQKEWDRVGGRLGDNRGPGDKTTAGSGPPVGSKREVKRFDGAINLLLTMTITLGPGFWNGYANFQFALLFWGVYLLAMRLQRDSVLVHLVLSLLIFFSHASVFIAFAGLVLTRVLFARLSWHQLAALGPSLMMFGWYLIATVRLDNIGPVNALGLMEWIQYKVYTVAKQGYFHNFILSDGSSLLGNTHAVYLAGVVLNLAVALIIIVWLLQQSWFLLKSAGVFPFPRVYQINVHVNAKTSAGRETGAEGIVGHRVTLIALLALLILFLAAGKNNFGVVNLGERFLIAALVLALVQLRCHRYMMNVWTLLAVVGAMYTMIATLLVSQYPVKEYAVARSTTSSTLDGAIDDIYANSRHKLFNHRLYIYADHGIWLQQPGTDFLPLKHITSFIVEK